MLLAWPDTKWELVLAVHGEQEMQEARERRQEGPPGLGGFVVGGEVDEAVDGGGDGGRLREAEEGVVGSESGFISTCLSSIVTLRASTSVLFEAGVTPTVRSPSSLAGETPTYMRQSTATRLRARHLPHVPFPCHARQAPVIF